MLVIEMENLLNDVLGVSEVKPIDSYGMERGMINIVHSFMTDRGKFFVKVNNHPEVRRMFTGEYKGLEALRATETVRCPKPVAIADGPEDNEVTFVIEHLDLQALEAPDQWAMLGEQVARLHLHNANLRAMVEKEEGRVGSQCSGAGRDEGGAGRILRYVSQHGFPITTCCGFIPLDNTWSDDWGTFFVRQRLKQQVDLIEREYGDREAREMWPLLERKILKFFEGPEVTPSLLHGDLNEGNIDQLASQPVVYDPNCFYGDPEFDLSIGLVFGGIGSDFYDAYHKLLPKRDGFHDRFEVYNLFHQLNHWNHFGPEKYKEPSLKAMNKVANKL